MKRVCTTLVALTLVSACGTTVPLTSQAPDQTSQGLNAPGVLAPPSTSDATATATQPRTSATDSSASAPSPTTTAPEHSAPSVVPPTANRAPLKIGITYAETGATARALGADDNSVNGKNTAQALVRAINASGGLHGRLLQPVTFGWDTTSSNYSTDAEAACQRFTRDEPVEVVIDSVFGIIGGFGTCLNQAGVLHLTSTTEGDRSSSGQRPLHVNTQVMVDDRTYGAVLHRLAGTGYLSKASQLGILLEQCADQEAAYRNTVEPLIRSLRLRTPVVRRVSCTTGFSSAGTAASTISNTVLAFQQARVDRVVLMSDYETVALLLFANAASSQAYHPGYLLSSNAQAEATRGSLPQDQWPQLHGVGISPGGDVSMTGVQPSAVESRCLSLARKGGLQASAQNDRTYVYFQCALLLLLDAALGKTNGSSTPTTLMTAITRLGTSFLAPGVLGGATRFAGRRFDGPEQVRVFAYEPTCACLTYQGKALPAPA